MQTKALSIDDLKKMSDAIRSISLDAINVANSGHPGMVLGMADIATVLFSEFLRFNPNDSNWPGRDRFVLSNGHGSMLLYSLLYLTGYDSLSIDDIKSFRQIGSKAAGHPESHLVDGIEVTTGPLGQGVANAVGIAIGQKILSKKFGMNFGKVYCFAGDGCLMEGISYEAMSLAGRLCLDNLVLIFDNNDITIDGQAKLSSVDNFELRAKSCNWDFIETDGHDFDDIRKGLSYNNSKPLFISAKTIIGKGVPKYEGTKEAHGSPFGIDYINEFKKNAGYPIAQFDVPNDVLNNWKTIGKRSLKEYDSWMSEFEKKSSSDYDQKKIFNELRAKYSDVTKADSTRKIASDILSEILPCFDNIVGSSADLSSSTLTKVKGMKDISADDFSGNYINAGIREHAMAGMANGLATCGFIPNISTFLVFSDYMRPSIRLAAMTHSRMIYTFTHDSIALGEDGPTHQPVEHVASLNSIPNLLVIRPCDALETIDAFELAMIHSGPTTIICSRQNINRVSKGRVDNYSKNGAYFINKSDKAKFVIIASGSEVATAHDVMKRLESDGISANLVSMPCKKAFLEQSDEYKSSILNSAKVRIIIEAGSSDNMIRFVRDGTDDMIFGVNEFGASGKSSDLIKKFGLDSESIYKKLSNLLGR